MNEFKGKTLLITGGTGSFGQAVLRRFLQNDIAQIRIFSRDEKKQDDMRRQYASDKLRFYIGDVRDPQAIDHAMAGVDYVFGAAALKQVPSCEFFPMEAVKTNVEGMYNTIQAAVKHRVQKMVCLSTDKAVYPINAMGISKALMEKVFIAESRNAAKTTICGTRYGNVMCSRGSVLWTFMEQIAQGKPLTVTDPDMTRFLMSLEESVDLVLYAFVHGQQGDRFVQKSPACRIETLAEAVKSLFCTDVPIQVIGTRHGEKRYETLLSREEMAVAVDMGSYYRIPSDNRDLNYSIYFEQGKKTRGNDEYNSDNTEQLDEEQVKQTLLRLPEIRSALEAYKA